MNTDHIVTNSKTQRMECQHCGFSEALKMPAPIDAILEKMDAFTKAHECCTRPQSEAVMSDYIKGFDAGYGYALHEVEQYIKRHDYEPRIAGPLLNLLAHLKTEGKEQEKLKGIAQQ